MNSDGSHKYTPYRQNSKENHIRRKNEGNIFRFGYIECSLGSGLVHSDCFIFIPAGCQNKLVILQSPDAEIYPPVSSNHQAGERKAGSLVLLLHRIDESGSDFCYSGGRIQGNLISFGWTHFLITGAGSPGYDLGSFNFLHRKYNIDKFCYLVYSALR